MLDISYPMCQIFVLFKYYTIITNVWTIEFVPTKWPPIQIWQLLLKCYVFPTVSMLSLRKWPLIFVLKANGPPFLHFESKWPLISKSKRPLPFSLSKMQIASLLFCKNQMAWKMWDHLLFTNILILGAICFLKLRKYE